MKFTPKLKVVLGLVVAGALVSSSAMAGEFNVWTYSKNNVQHSVVVSFSGNGVDQEAMVDLVVPKNVTLVKAETLVPGSVCVGLDNNSYIRAVPPSGAGSPLPSSDTDYCRFTFQANKSARADRTARTSKLVLKQKFIECSSPGSEIVGCGLGVYDVSEKSNRAVAQ